MLRTKALSKSGMRMQKQWPFHLMLLPGVIFLLVYCYYPMVGLLIAFEDYNPRLGFFRSPWVGMENFEYLFTLPNFPQVLFNTFYIALMKIILSIVVPIFIAILLDMMRRKYYKKTLQTILYMPYFLSWVVLAGIIMDILSPSTGIVNRIITFFGGEPIFFLADPASFPYTIVITDIWKNAGYSTVIYLAAITSIDQGIYEAALVDGANRAQQAWHITLKGITPIIIVMGTLSLGSILNAGFDQVLNLYSPIVYKTGDILDTFVYRIGIVNSQYGIAAAAGLFKSVVSLAFISGGYYLAKKLANYSPF